MNGAYLHFLGFVANADDTICKIRLEDEFSFDTIEYGRTQAILQAINHNLSVFDIHKLKYNGYGFQVVRRAIRLPDSRGESRDHAFNELGPQIERAVYRVMSALRLHNENCVYIPFHFIFAEDSGRYSAIARFEDHNLYHQANKLHISDSEKDALQSFIDGFATPFSKEFVQLSFDMYETSFKGSSINIKFLCVMFGLEALFNVGTSEITKTIARHVGVLLSRNKNEGERIYKDVRRYYRLRSEVVHGRQKVNVTEQDLYGLRGYLRESIKMALNFGMDKPELFDLLNEHGFGELNWTI